jgi:PGF-pre-PGF domain-containing protein
VATTTTTTTTTTTSITTTTLDGGGGGGGGGPPVTIKVNVSADRVEISGISMGGGGSKAMEISDWNGRLHRLVAYTEQSISDGKITIERLDSWEVWEVPEMTDRKVYKYLKIEKENIGEMKSLTFYFSVEKDWLKENSVESVGLWRYDGGWKRLEIEKEEEIYDIIKYRASLPGFSYFAIAGTTEDYVAGVTTTTAPVPWEVFCGNGICENGETEENCPTDCLILTPERGMELILLIAALALIVSALVAWTKFKKRVPKLLKAKKTLKIGQILARPEKYLGKDVRVECDIEPYHYLETQKMTVYTMSDDTGRILGISRHSEYEGEGIVKGVLRKGKRDFYIEF